ncbi:hypothetical protein DFH07DRAFT_949412 [Mycena maculata]|uniref:Uncharacterized protein n=1 Tax=Mycena maculata TaxID=230809 RepID=A0AAD7KAP2_9AGAR|nr:hypothetical protein DFH07DRAFT_949412 [Mycena maculata]
MLDDSLKVAKGFKFWARMRIQFKWSTIDQGWCSKQPPRPQWMRVFATEIMRGCDNHRLPFSWPLGALHRLRSDAESMRNVWVWYDCQSGSNVLTAAALIMIKALKRLLAKKPALLGVSAQMFGVEVQRGLLHNHAFFGGIMGLDVP